MFLCLGEYLLSSHELSCRSTFYSGPLPFIHISFVVLIVELYLCLSIQRYCCLHLGTGSEGAPCSWTFPIWVKLPSHWAGLWLKRHKLSLSSLRFSKFLWRTNCIFICCIGASLIAQLVKNLPAVQETWVQFLGWEDPLEGSYWNGNPFQYSCLENPIDRRAWRATVHGVARESDMTLWLNNLHHYHQGQFQDI